MAKEKTCLEMTFQEFKYWAKEQLMRDFLDKGIKGLDDALWLILNQAMQNTVWGGGKKK